MTHYNDPRFSYTIQNHRRHGQLNQCGRRYRIIEQSGGWSIVDKKFKSLLSSIDRVVLKWSDYDDALKMVEAMEATEL